MDQRPSHGGRLAPAAFKGDARLLRAAFQAWRPQLRCLATVSGNGDVGRGESLAIVRCVVDRAS